MSASALLVFREGDVGLIKTTDVVLNACKLLSTGASITTTEWTITELAVGAYYLTVPEATGPMFVSAQNIKALTESPPATVKCEATSSDGWATVSEISALLAEKAATAAAIRLEMDTNSTRLAAIEADTTELLDRLEAMAPDNVFTAESFANVPTATVVGGVGTGQVLFKWYEYDRGFSGDPSHAVSGVIVAVYTTEDASSPLEASAVTDETGCAMLWLNEGVYYVFRRKAGRAFTNPIMVTVSHTAGDSVEEDALALDYIRFSWAEYEEGYEGNPAYAIADVDVAVHTDIAGTGTPFTSARTGANGLCEFFVPAGTYYLFRSKAGRVFTNPATITASA